MAPGAPLSYDAFLPAQEGLREALTSTAGAFRAFSDGLHLVVALRTAGVRLASESSSKNAADLLSRVRVPGGGRLIDLFDVDVSGRALTHGKPHPELFLTAARELDCAPSRCLVVEDAPVGIQAAKAGGMTALGVARGDDASQLAAAGADLVVASLDEVDREALHTGHLVALAPLGR